MVKAAVRFGRQAKLPDFSLPHVIIKILSIVNYVAELFKAKEINFLSDSLHDFVASDLCWLPTATSNSVLRFEGNYFVFFLQHEHLLMLLRIGIR